MKPSMKKSTTAFLKLFCVNTLVLVSGLLQAQPGTLRDEKAFEGYISYAVSYSGPAAEDFKLMEPPKKMDMILKGGDFIVQMYGGAFSKSLLYINDSNRTYVVDVPKMTAYRQEKYRVRRKQPLKAVPTNDSLKIAGHMCYGFVATRPATPKTPAAKIKLYVTGKVRVNLDLFKGKDRSHAYFLIDGLQGCIPLKIVVEEPHLITENLAVKLTRGTYELEQFRLPPGMKIKKWDSRR